MKNRRSLVEGLSKPEERKKEESFVYGAKTKSLAKQPKKAKEPKEAREVAPAPPPSALVPGQAVTRSPLTTRIRSDIGAALKRASLERQLAGELPNTVQDILEQALEPWLKEKGYLKD